MITYAQVNLAIRAIDPSAELVKGDGYHYFTGDSVNFAYTTSVMAATLNSLTIEMWVYEFIQIRESSTKKDTTIRSAPFTLQKQRNRS